MVRYWNSGATKALGYDQATMLGSPLRAIVPPEQRPAHDRSFEAAVRRGSTVLAGRSIDLPALHADGRIRLIELRISHVAEPSSGFVGVFRDVTELRQQEAEERAAAERERDLVREAFELSRLDAGDAKDFVARVVDRVARMLDAAVEVRGGKGAADHAAGAKVVLEVPIRALDSLYGSLTIERDRPLTPAEQRFVEDVSSTLAHGFARAERARLEVRAQSLLAAVSDGLIAHDAAGRVTFVNGHAAELTGWAESEALGLRVEEVIVLARFGDRSRLVTRAGDLVEVNVEWSSWVDDEGKAGGLIALRDVTALERAERRQQRLAAGLGVAAQLTRSLLLGEGVDAALGQALAAIGSAMLAERVIFVDGEPRWRWGSDAPSEGGLDECLLESSALQAHLAPGAPWIVSDLHELSHDEAEALRQRGLETFVVVPIPDANGAKQRYFAVENPRADSWQELVGALVLIVDALVGRERRDHDHEVLESSRDLLVEVNRRQDALIELAARLGRVSDRDEAREVVESVVRATLRAQSVTLVDDRDGERWLAEVGSLDAERTQSAVFVAGAGSERADGGKVVAVPLLGRAGALGYLRITLPKEAEAAVTLGAWCEQAASLVAAHLEDLDAEKALEELAERLEGEVERRTAALDATQRRWARLFEQAPVALVMVEPGGMIRDANSRADALFHRSLRGGNIHDFVDPAVRPHHERWVREQRARGGPMSAAPVEVRRADGTSFHGEVHLVPMAVDEEPVVLAGIIDVTAAVDARGLIERSLREKETLLKEIHHRVKNNLQIIASLLNLQAANAGDGAKELWQESVHRVRSMALVHEHLYGDASHEHLDLASYLKRLVDGVRAASTPRRFELELESVPVALDVATPIGLVANELVTNAIKYGEPVEGDGWEVNVRLVLYDAGFRLVVETRGPGIDRPLQELSRGRTLGVRLVLALVQQLRGQVRVEGSAIVVEIPHQLESTTSDDAPDEAPKGASGEGAQSGSPTRVGQEESR